jgi:hypothetical protein
MVKHLRGFVYTSTECINKTLIEPPDDSTGAMDERLRSGGEEAEEKLSVGALGPNCGLSPQLVGGGEPGHRFGLL